MWVPSSPLRIYMKNEFKKDSAASDLKKWATMAPLYQNYGTYLIKQYPKKYFQYYLWPNVMKYYTPPIEFLETYNMGRDTVQKRAKIWFGYSSNKVKNAFNDNRVTVLNFYPILTAIMNVLFLVSFVCFVILNRWKQNQQLSKTLLLVAVFWLVNFGFSVFAAPITLRYQLFPLLLFISFGLVLVDYLVKEVNVEMKDLNSMQETYSSPTSKEVNMKHKLC
jgi:hypothetical protein